jgi:hypothetical protein
MRAYRTFPPVGPRGVAGQRAAVAAPPVRARFGKEAARQTVGDTPVDKQARRRQRGAENRMRDLPTV